MSTLVWTLVIAVALIVQALVMRIAHRRALGRQQARHQQHQQTLNGQFEQTRKQIGQLQSDLATARRELRQLDVAAMTPGEVIDWVLSRQSRLHCTPHELFQ